MQITDTHAHIYSSDEKTYPPISSPNRPPPGAGTVERLRRDMQSSGVTRACLVQVSSFYGFDNSFLCDTANAQRGWSAGVCTLDPDDPHSPGLLKHFVSKYGVRAMRSIPGRDGKLDSSGVAALWKACGEAGIVANVLCNIDNADAFARMLERFPRQPVVIDHCLNLKAGPSMQPILADMLRLAHFPNTYPKLSYLATGSAEEYPFRDMHASCHQLIAAYSPARCIWGSDYPCELWTPKATYKQAVELFTRQLGLNEVVQKSILETTPGRLYAFAR